MPGNPKRLAKAITNTNIRNLAAGYLKFFKPKSSTLEVKDLGICFGASSVNVSADLNGERQKMYSTLDSLHAYQHKEEALFTRVQKMKERAQTLPAYEITEEDRETLNMASYLENMIIHHLPLEQREHSLYGPRVSQGYLNYYHLHGIGPRPTQLVHTTLAPTPDELLQHFRDLSSRRDNQFGPISMILCSVDHGISISPEAQGFHFFDINQLSVNLERQHQPRILSAAEAQHAVFTSFLDATRTLFNVQAFASPRVAPSEPEAVYFNTHLDPSTVTNLTNDNGDSVLFSAAKHQDLETLKRITHLPGDILWPKEAFIQALAVAAIVQATDSLDILRDSASNEQGYPNQNETLSQYVAFWAIQANSKVMLKGMLDAGEPIDGHDKTGMSLPLFAVVKKKYEMLRYLLELGADANALHLKTGTSPLIEAIKCSNVEAVTLLLQHGANPNLCLPESDLSPLHLAASLGVHPIIKELIQHGAEVNLVCSQNKTALDYAKLSKDESAITLIEQSARTHLTPG
jgi:hypothetical protein